MPPAPLMQSRHADANTAAALAVRGLAAAYGSHRILSAIDFSVSCGEIFVIMGASGAGKTTLLRPIFGLAPPICGTVEMLGAPLHPTSRAALYQLRRHIGVAFQHGALINSLSVRDNVELPLRQHTRLDRTTIRIMSRMKLEMMNLLDCEDLRPAQLSGGMLKRAGLARGVVMDPPLLFFDEPSAGLDPVNAAALDQLILKLRAAHGMTVVVVTQVIESAFKIADRILILADGGICALGTVAAIRRHSDARVQALIERRPGAHAIDADSYLARLTAAADD